MSTASDTKKNTAFPFSTFEKDIKNTANPIKYTGPGGISRQGGLMKISLAAWRKNAGYTQTGLAEALGYERKTVWKWENGLSTPTIPDVEMMARLFGCEPGDISLPEKRT
jgi:DNA-binding XRE family transcriptional regulator